ncbi:MAG TPA: porin family protein [Segetibacter sp.]
MKRQILLAALILTSTFSFAQVKPDFGIRGGLSSAGMRGEAVNNLQNLLDFADGMITTNDRLGFFAGAYSAISVSKVISIEPALYYTQKGYTMTGDLNIKGAEFIGANAKASLNASYIDLPVLIKANVKGLQLFAGPQVSYLMQADLKTTAGVLGFNLFNRKMNATEQFNRWDAGVTGGIGYQFANGINIMASYDHGLSKVDADKNLESYNRSFKVGLGMSF